MPHLVILYTPQLDKETDMDVLCRSLANTILAARDENGVAVFPPGVRACWLSPPRISQWQMTAALAVQSEARATTPLFICNCVWPMAEHLPRTRRLAMHSYKQHKRTSQIFLTNATSASLCKLTKACLFMTASTAISILYLPKPEYAEH